MHPSISKSFPDLAFQYDRTFFCISWNSVDYLFFLGKAEDSGP